MSRRGARMCSGGDGSVSPPRADHQREAPPGAVAMAQLPGSPLPTLKGRFTEDHATRLLWRAGFGPRRGEAARLAARGLDGAVASLTRPSGPVKLIGRAPHGEHGRPLDPIDVWGDDHCWWLDRMVRSDRPLQERMTLIWHSWFATSIDGATQKLMLRQNAMMRSHWLGQLPRSVARRDPRPGDAAVAQRRREQQVQPQRELRARDDGAVHARARAAATARHDVAGAGARADRLHQRAGRTRQGPHNFRFDPDLHDDGIKKIFGAPRALRLARLLPAVRRAPRRTPRSWSPSCGATSSPSRSPADVARALERTYVAAASRPPADGGDPASPAVLRGRADGHPAGRATAPGCSARSVTPCRPTPGPGSPSSPDRSCSSRPTSPAGTTPTGWTPRAGRDDSPPSATRSATTSSIRPRTSPIPADETPPRPWRRRSRYWGDPELSAGDRAQPARLQPQGRSTRSHADLGAGPVPGAAPERAARADSD